MRLATVCYLLLAALVVTRCGVAAAQDIAAGEKTFNVCRACHQIGDRAMNSIGPVLTGVVGRKAGSFPGYNYSDANKNSASLGMRRLSRII